MSHTHCKICGITRLEDGLDAARLGVSAIGLVFYSKSKRAVNIMQAKVIAEALPPFVTIVGLFVNPTKEFVQEVLTEVPLDILQFHGEETEAFCTQFGRRYCKAVPMKDKTKLQAEQYIAAYPQACAFLFDAFGGNTTGGSGVTFDWAQIPATDKPVIIAGGLTPENVAEVVAKFQPYAVDVSSGVEMMPGIKSFAKMERFIHAATSQKL